MLKKIYFVPHGGVMVPGMEPGRNEAAENLNKAMKTVAADVKESKIDLIILIGPHGYAHPSDWLVYFHTVYEAWQYFRGGDEVQVEQKLWNGNIDVAQALYRILAEAGIRSAPLLVADPNFPLKLAWGEAIPLSYIADGNGPQIVILSPPMMLVDPQNTKDNDTLDLLTKVGQLLSHLSNSSTLEKSNVALVISGDLAHTHDAEHEYGFSNKAAPFDSLAKSWAVSPTQEGWKELNELHQEAHSCGINGMGILLGAMEGQSWTSSKTIYECPTYFGMMVSSWTS